MNMSEHLMGQQPRKKNTVFDVVLFSVVRILLYTLDIYDCKTFYRLILTPPLTLSLCSMIFGVIVWMLCSVALYPHSYECGDARVHISTDNNKLPRIEECPPNIYFDASLPSSIARVQPSLTIHSFVVHLYTQTHTHTTITSVFYHTILLLPWNFDFEYSIDLIINMKIFLHFTIWYPTNRCK